MAILDTDLLDWDHGLGENKVFVMILFGALGLEGVTTVEKVETDKVDIMVLR